MTELLGGSALGVALAVAVWALRKLSQVDTTLADLNGKKERRTADGQVVLEPRRPGVVEQLQGHDRRLQEIKEQVDHVVGLLNGGGLGSQMRVVEATLHEHLEQADATRDQVLRDVRETRRDLGEAVIALTTNQQRLEERVDSLDGKVTGRLEELTEANSHLRAALTESLLVDEDEE